MSHDPSNLETDSRFPSGEWVGFFLQPSIAPGQFRMDMHLEFRNGVFTGEGVDGYDKFTIHGRYDLKTGNVKFDKKYFSYHPIFPYRGCNEGKGIWGMGSYLNHKGGFSIWPKGMLGWSGEHLTKKVEIPVEQEKAVLAGVEDSESST